MHPSALRLLLNLSVFLYNYLSLILCLSLFYRCIHTCINMLKCAVNILSMFPWELEVSVKLVTHFIINNIQHDRCKGNIKIKKIITICRKYFNYGIVLYLALDILLNFSHQIITTIIWLNLHIYNIKFFRFSCI